MIKTQSFFREYRTDNFKLCDSSEDASCINIIYSFPDNREKLIYKESTDEFIPLEQTGFERLKNKVDFHKYCGNEICTDETLPEIFDLHDEVNRKFPNRNKKSSILSAANFKRQMFNYDYFHSASKIGGTQNKPDSTDSLEISDGIFRFDIITDTELKQVTLKFHLIHDMGYRYFKKLSKFKITDLSLTFDFNSGCMNSSNMFRLFKGIEIPQNVMDSFNSEFNSIRNLWAGKNLSHNSSLQNLDFAKSAVKFPYEPNLDNITYNYFIASEEIEKLRNIPEAYNKLCRKLEIKSCTSLNRLYLENPNIIFKYKILKMAGFTDANIINSILTENEDSIHCYDNYSIEAFASFFKNFIRKHGEACARNFIRKSCSILFWDALVMYEKYSSHLTNEVRRKILSEGFTEYNHDILSKLSQIMETKKVTYKYDSFQRSLEKKIHGIENDYEFRLPKNTHELIDLGTSLNNCVTTYSDKIVRKASTIVYAKKNSSYAICIEVKDRTVVQVFGRNNHLLKDEDLFAFNEWLDESRLTKS